MFTKKTALTVSAVAALVVTSALAQGPEISTIRKAAIEKLQEKLGEIRGSIKPKETRVFLTNTIIQRLKPIQPDEIIVASHPVAPVQFNHDGQAHSDAIAADQYPEVSEVTSSGWENEADKTDQDVLERKIDAIAASNAARSERLQREIFRAIRINVKNSQSDETLITNSIGGGTLPNTSDMTALLAAVESMVASQQ